MFFFFFWGGGFIRLAKTLIRLGRYRPMSLHIAAYDISQGQNKLVLCIQRPWSFKSVSSEICIWTASWQNQQSAIYAQRRLRSTYASAQSDQSSLCTQWVAKVPMFLQGASEDSHQTGRCPCWYEPSLEADVILSCGGSLIALKEFTVENHYMWKNRKSNISSCVVRCQATDQTIFILLLQSADIADNDR